MSVTDSGINPELSGHQLKQFHLINLQLAALGHPVCDVYTDQYYLRIADNLLKNYTQQRRLLAGYRCPSDLRIQEFLTDYLCENGVASDIALPDDTFVLEQGLARELSLPFQANEFHSDYVDSYRVRQGILHNPKNDRRTTKGVFHIAAGGLPVPADKNEVPVRTYAKLLQNALNPPDNLLCLPFTSKQKNPARLWLSLYLRPIVVPEIAGIAPEKSMETRFFAPAGLVANLDFVESIFGNAGNPFIPENDAALDIRQWTGQTGCIILAPHLVSCRKVDIGLPPYSEATDRQRRDGMCWQHEDELYNDGKPFKLVCRNMKGVIVTVIADNYFGYSKKEIKSQISYAANLYGGCEEEHAGGALAFARANLGEFYLPSDGDSIRHEPFDKIPDLLGNKVDLKAEGYAVDKTYPHIFFLPESARIDAQTQQILWERAGETVAVKLLADHVYMYPNGFYVFMEKHPNAPSWRLIGTYPEGTLCHKPSTVSGGGKSEIAKSIGGAILFGSIFVGNYDKDMDFITEIFNKDYSNRFRDSARNGTDRRRLLSNKRSLGSVIKLLTPSQLEYSDEYNEWLMQIPQHIWALVLMIRRFFKPEWGDNWREHFSVDLVNGYQGNELKYHGRKLIASYLRVGYDTNGAWRVFKLRQDFIASAKIQFEDDITASTVIQAHRLPGLNPDYTNRSVKLVANCEHSFFQRPDDAINRGTDLQTELDLSGENNFISNFQPLTGADARELIEDVVHFEEFSAPMRQFICRAAHMPEGEFFVSSAHPRIVDGKLSQNVRYLQQRPDFVEPFHVYLAELSTRLARNLQPEQPVYFPVNAVMPGRRNNPPDPATGIRPLAIYNPIHYQELPELFMDFICSLTGKSPSTTGAGSEGALTKGPFNALCATADLNNALVSYILCGYDGYTSAAGHIGPHRRIDHDISLLIPEIWSRLPVHQRNPENLIKQGQLEKLEDFEYEGRKVRASRLGYRITERFVHAVFGKMFDYPTAVFDQAMLKPETQDLASFVDGIDNVCQAQRQVALLYFEDGSIEDACPPLKALLHIMAYDHFDGKSLDEPEIRQMFTLDYLLNSDWYLERLKIKQQRDCALWQKHRDYLLQRLNETETTDTIYLELTQKLEVAERKQTEIADPSYPEFLRGTLGADWIHRTVTG